MAKQRRVVCLILLACTASGGCGLVEVPYIQTLPSEPLRRVIVHDLESSEPIEANVTFAAYRWENWLEPIPVWGDVTTEPVSQPALEHSADHEVFSLQADPVGRGVYRFSPQARWSSATVWCPLPPVLGCFLHKCYDGRIQIMAPGYKGAWIGNAVLPKQIPESVRPGTEARIRFERDGLHVFLPRLNQEGEGTSTTKTWP